MQYRRPLGAGPSGKTWPRWASHVLQMVSTRCRKLGPSKRYAMTLAFTGCVKEGHPVPDSNFSDASNRTVPQQRQEYIPGSNRLHICELNARSVPASRVRCYSSGLNCFRHSASAFSSLRSGAGLPFFARLRTSGHFSIVSTSIDDLAPGCWFAIRPQYCEKTRNVEFGRLSPDVRIVSARFRSSPGA